MDPEVGCPECSSPHPQSELEAHLRSAHLCAYFPYSCSSCFCVFRSYRDAALHLRFGRVHPRADRPAIAEALNAVFEERVDLWLQRPPAPELPQPAAKLWLPKLQEAMKTSRQESEAMKTPMHSSGPKPQLLGSEAESSEPSAAPPPQPPAEAPRDLRQGQATPVTDFLASLKGPLRTSTALSGRRRSMVKSAKPSSIFSSGRKRLQPPPPPLFDQPDASVMNGSTSKTDFPTPVPGPLPPVERSEPVNTVKPFSLPPQSTTEALTPPSSTFNSSSGNQSAVKAEPDEAPQPTLMEIGVEEQTELELPSGLPPVTSGPPQVPFAMDEASQHPRAGELVSQEEPMSQEEQPQEVKDDPSPEEEEEEPELCSLAEVSPPTPQPTSDTPLPAASAKCLICQRAISQDWKSHVALHLNLPLFRCPKCTHTQKSWRSSPSAQKRHFELRHPKQPFKDFLDLRPGLKAKFDEMRRRCLGKAEETASAPAVRAERKAKVGKLDLRPASVAQPSVLERSASVAPTKPETYPWCGKCQRRLSGPNWRDHVVVNHLQEATFTCALCDFKLQRWALPASARRSHFDKEHPGQPVSFVDRTEQLAARVEQQRKLYLPEVPSGKATRQAHFGRKPLRTAKTPLKTPARRNAPPPPKL